MLRRALQYQRLCGGVLALHEEDPALSGAGVMHEGVVSALLGVAGIPSISESTMVARDAEIAGYEGGACTCSTSAASRRSRRSRWPRRTATRSPARRARTTCCLTDEAVRTLDTRMKMNPPLRTEADRQALIEGLRSGVIDCVATDHAPHARDEKEVPFEQAPMGTTGLETSFAALYTELVLPGVLDLELLVERMTGGGALFDLPIAADRGRRAREPLPRRPRREWVVGEDGYESRSENCCFAGRDAARPGAADRRRRRGRLPRARLRGAAAPSPGGGAA